ERTFLDSHKKYGEYFMATRRLLTGYEILIDRRANKCTAFTIEE
ncbi:unnamed protein product, partial [Rotaria sp. Silwood1]